MIAKKQKADFKSVDIIYEPVKRLDEIIECYFTTEINLAFRAKLQHHKNDRLRSLTTFPCYYCSVFVSGKSMFEKHFTVCAKKAGILYKFNNQHLTTFEDNFKLLDNLPFYIYFDLETTSGKKIFLAMKIQ